MIFLGVVVITNAPIFIISLGCSDNLIAVYDQRLGFVIYGKPDWPSQWLIMGHQQIRRKIFCQHGQSVNITCD